MQIEGETQNLMESWTFLSSKVLVFIMIEYFCLASKIKIQMTEEKQ